MNDNQKEQSNPYSTGSGGANFETNVQAAFALQMLIGGFSPFLPLWPITKIKLQGSYAGFKTDDFIVFTKDPRTSREARLLGQIKHNITITKNDKEFGEVIQAAWKDFNDPQIFSQGSDRFALISGPLRAIDTNNVRPILEWARHSENESEFLLKVNTERFSNKIKKDKVEAFKTQLIKANNGEEIAENQLWEFLKHFYILGYDLDYERGVTPTLVHSIIAQNSTEEPAALWAKLVQEIRFFNQDGGTLSLDTISEDIRESFNPIINSHWYSDRKKLEEHSNYILNGINSEIGGVHIDRSSLFSQLIEISEGNEFVLITGGRGSGKSALAAEFADYVKGKAPVFCLRTEDLDKAHLDNVFSAIGLTGSLDDLSAGFALTPKKYLIIESLEKLLELNNRAAFTDLIQFVQKTPGWTVIASMRDYAYQQISFNYLQDCRYSTLMIDNFSEDNIHQLCEKLSEIRPFVNTPSIKSLLLNPFYAELAYRVAKTGTQFSSKDGEKEFQKAVWENIISKESERADGIPSKRKNIFIDIAVRRAKKMVYEVPDIGYDANALFKLEEDNLICRTTNGMVRPAHDVLEDWALEEYIENEYRSNLGNVGDFLSAIGKEPAINRAFRLWLYQKLRFGEDVSSLILDILNDEKIERCWQDETISTVLLSDNPYEFLDKLNEQLFENDCELLKRFCFLLRLSCKVPDHDLMNRFSITDTKKSGVFGTLYLKPYGKGWDDLIHFIFENQEIVSLELLPHISAVLEDWSSLIYIGKELPRPAREVGLLALHLLDFVKDSYGEREGTDRKKLIRVIIKTAPAIQQEFIEMLDVDLFNIPDNNRRLRYLDDFVEMSLLGIETAFLCKTAPDVVTKIVKHEWLIADSKEEISYSHMDVDEYFGIIEYHSGSNFFPPSGAKGPFQYLLSYHFKEGLDFIIELLNIAAEKYADSDLESPERYSSVPTDSIQSGVDVVEIQLNDGTLVKQFCSERLWLGYRSFSVLPYILQSALMALENQLVFFAKELDSTVIEGIFHAILKNSNSVMPTAVLASVATGFPEKLGRAALPILRTPEFYYLDLQRMIRERGAEEGNMFNAMVFIDPFSKTYERERRTAAMQPWRGKDLEFLITHLQFSGLREDIFSILDEFRSNNSEDECWHFRLPRIDTRCWESKIDSESKTIYFTSPDLEPELKEVQEKTEDDQILNNRIITLTLWSDESFKNKKLEREYYSNWNEALAEAKNLLELLNSGEHSNYFPIFSGSIIKAAAVLLRDYSKEMVKDDLYWCIELLVLAVLKSAKTENTMLIADVTDGDGAAASASVLPIILDFASEGDELYTVKSIIATAITHPNENVRIKAANGIQEYLWQRDPDFAQKCILGAIEYSRLNSNVLYQATRTNPVEDFKKDNGADNWPDDFCDKLVRGVITTNIDHINFKSHNSHYILSAFLMIPKGSTEAVHISLFQQMINLLIEAEKVKSISQSEQKDEVNIPYDFPLKFSEIFANYLFYLSDPSVEEIFVKELLDGCTNAPHFIDSVLTYLQVFADKTGNKERYWQLCGELSETVQQIAVQIANESSQNRHYEDKRKLIRNMLFTSISEQYVKHEYDNIDFGKKLILEFVTNAGVNSDVFGAMSSLMFYFPDIFLESGLTILSNHQKNIGGTKLFSSNTIFYLERNLSRYLFIEKTELLSEKQYQSCKILLDALAETGSSCAYFLREHLIGSRKISV